MPFLLIIAGVAALAVGAGVFFLSSPADGAVVPKPDAPAPSPGVTKDSTRDMDAKTDGTVEKGAVEPAERFAGSPAATMSPSQTNTTEDPFSDVQEYDPAMTRKVPPEERPVVVPLWVVDESVTPRDKSMAPDEVDINLEERFG